MSREDKLRRARERVDAGDFLDDAGEIPAELLHALGRAAVAPEDAIDSGTAHLASGIDRPLSGRELEVVRWLSVGLVKHEIADVMCVTVETVKSHVKNAKRVARAKTAAHLVAVALRNGWIS